MNKTEFEDAVLKAVNAPSANGAKWKHVIELFEPTDRLVGGAISNQHPEQRTRVRQLLTRRNFKGTSRYFQNGAYVLNKDQASRHKADPDKVLGSVVDMFKLERPNLPPSECLESVIIFRHDAGSPLVPLAIVKWGNDQVTQQFETWYPSAPVIDESSSLTTSHPQGGPTIVSSAGPAENKIFFGPPGTGKSYKIKEATADFFDVVNTAFHPEYSYADFVGSYKPVCGTDTTETITSYTGQADVPRPVIYYAFDPGSLLRAIVRAHDAEGAPVALVIDELNRGDCAAIFGDFMHLLDRADNGQSEYGIDVPGPIGAYLVAAEVLQSPEEKLYLPPNLFIFATINTSDQALYPMDSAFKRRWGWEAVPVEGNEDLEDVRIPAIGTSTAQGWLSFITRLNEIILDKTGNEDKRIGPWYIRARSGEIPVGDIRNKLLYFLWHDVFRGRATDAFKPELRTFEAVQKAFDQGGLDSVLSGLNEPAPTDENPEEDSTSNELASTP